MIQSIVEGILNRLIGEYIENLDSKQLNVSVSELPLFHFD